MRSFKHGHTLGVKEHLLKGGYITRLEALILFGVQNLAQVISAMRRSGQVVHSRPIPYAAAVKRVNEHAALAPPNNLPIREIQLTEYWLSR